MSVSDDRVLRLLKEARERLELERRRRTEPIAIVGMGCRFPGGASSPEQFWDLLVQGIDATSEVPADRWDAEALYDSDSSAPGKCYAKRGGFLERIDGFEPEFFGISPREAAALDPQQRLLLEVTWEALEDARLAPTALRETNTGVWIGSSLDDYATRSLGAGQLSRIDAYTALGNARSVAAGRIAYVLGLHGPVLQLDTACSSSLVAIHLACQSLRAGECRLALVGGVNLISSPEASVALCKLQALARDGRCKTFDARADGYGRGEGCGMVVLKPLSAAEAQGDRIYAIIRGSAVNHDGASNGLTAPNGLAQEAVIGAALANADAAACEVDYVEAHGTGTLLGDPIEVLALNRVYGVGRRVDAPLYLGSVKTNLGHLEAAAGIAALIKTALCLSHRELVPSLHFRDPNPKIPWRDLAVRVATRGADWPGQSALKLAGVSSFGISGTNAHVIVGAPVARVESATTASRSAELVLLSARTDAALQASAARLALHVRQHPESALGDLAYSAATTRALLERRACFVVGNSEALLAALDEFSGRAANAADAAPRTRGKLAWLFTGQGAQRPFMGEQLYREWPAFRGALDAVFAVTDPQLGEPLRDVMWAAPGTAAALRLDRTAFTQPALFAFGWALAALWRSWGVEPDFVAGHSIGEVTAACVAGVLSLEDAVRLVCERGRLMQALPDTGAMIAIACSRDQVCEVLATLGDRAALAASNAPSSVVISGERAAVLSVAEHFAARGVATKRLSVSHAFHSPLMDPMLAEFRRVVDTLSYRSPSTPLISNLSGELAGAEVMTPGYWVRHAREPVRFAEGIAALRAGGAGSFLELGPKAVLLPSVAATLSQGSRLLLASGDANRAETETALAALGKWLLHGGTPEWAGVFPHGGQRCQLPGYPWQRERYWLSTGTAPPAAGQATPHPLLGTRLRTAGSDALFELNLSTQDPAWLADHTVAGLVVLPASAVLELIRAAAEEHRDGMACEIVSLVLSEPLIVPERGTRRVQVVLSRDGSRASLHSQAGDAPAGAAWTSHATAELAEPPQAADESLSLSVLRARCSEALDIPALYEAFRAAGLGYGPAFRGLKRAWRGAGEILAEIELGNDLDATGFGLHPALLDAALQSIAGLLASDQRLLLPFRIERCVVRQLGSSVANVYARWTEPRAAERVLIDLTLADAAGDVVATLEGLHLRSVPLSAFADFAGLPRVPSLHRLDWQLANRPAATPMPDAERWAVLSIDDEAKTLSAGLTQAGLHVESVNLAQLAESSAEQVVCIWPALTTAESAMRAAEQGLSIAQALATRARPPRLWWLTRQAVALPSDEALAPAGACLWGLGRTVMQELPGLLDFTLLDLGPEEISAQVLLRERAITDGETQLVSRAGHRHRARLLRCSDSAEQTAGELPFRPDGTVLITGGLGALGSELARWFARRGARHLLLIGRRGLATPGATEVVLELQGLGAQVSVADVDIADFEGLTALISSLPVGLPLRTVVHAAGVIDDGLLTEQTPARFRAVMMPKVLGAWNLHRCTEHSDLDAFVCVSSVAATLGSAGQGSYAAANAFLDGLVSLRRARHLPGSSLAFGPLQAGLAEALDPRHKARLQRQGLRPLSMAEALALFDSALRRPEPALVAAGFDLRQLGKAFRASVPSVWRALLRKTQATPPVDRLGFAKTLLPLSDDERRRRVTELVQEHVARTLSIASARAVPLDLPLKDSGLDSLTALELNNSLELATGLRLPAALIFQQPSARMLAQNLLEQTLGVPESARVLSHVDSAQRAARFRSDALLASEIRPSITRPPALEPESVLLTGATGFLGAYLLHELLSATGAHVHCLVRAADQPSGGRRVADNLRRYGLWQDAFAARISIVVGDLKQPRLGLSPKSWGDLAERVDSIFNNGALLGFVADYSEMKASHVDPTIEILRLACTGRSKAVHHVSSTVVFDAAAYRRRTVSESTLPLECDGMQVGYSQCKWVTETLVHAAAERGVPVTVHRPDFIAGSAVDGAFNTADFLARLLKSIIEIGSMPGDLDLELYFAPVDYVSASIVQLSLQPGFRGRTSHLQHPRGIHLATLGQNLRALGYEVQSVPYWEWVARLETRRDGPLAPLMPFLMQRWAPDGLTYLELLQSQYRPRLTCDETLRALAGSGIECPASDGALLERYLQYFARTGFIEERPSRPARVESKPE